MVEILPFVEQQNLRDTIAVGAPIADAPENIFRPPSVFLCPRRTVLQPIPANAISPGHYVFVHGSVFDAPTTFSVPWINGPVMNYNTLLRSIGPHSNGFFQAQVFQQGVQFVEGGQEVR